MTPAARVVPNVPSFSVDDGFWYSIPSHLESDIEIGRLVRVPLSGRRVRGWVVEIGERDQGRLKPIAGVSGEVPVFDRKLLESLTWASNHYVAPRSVLLSKATPPNLPKKSPGPDLDFVGSTDHPLGDFAEDTAQGRARPITALVGQWKDLSWLVSVGPVLTTGGSVLIVAATIAESRRIESAASSVFGELVVAANGDDDRSITTAWVQAQAPGRVVIGTPRVATWAVGGLRLALVIEESRRAMKERQTPTLHVRDVMVTRSRIERFNLVFFGPTPGVELVGSGAEIVRMGNRAWPLVEVVDRSEDTGGFVSSRTMPAIEGVVDSGRSVFVFTHRRRASASTRCSQCRMLRRCTQCGWRLGRVASCPNCDAPTQLCAKCGGEAFEEMGTVPERLAEEMNRRAGRPIADVSPAVAPVTVGTERDLASAQEAALVVAADVDGMLLGTGYRVAEEALRQLARLGSLVAGGTGSRLLLQTSTPDSALVKTMRRGDPMPYLERILVERARDRFPPSADLIAIELRGGKDVAVDFDGAPSEATIMGPIQDGEDRRWLISGKLGSFRRDLRQLVGRWRDAGATVRVDVDPIDI